MCTFFYVHIFNVRDGHMTTFRLYLPNAWSQTLQTNKRHTFRVSAFHRYHWFGVKLYPVDCAQDSRIKVTLQREKCCFGIWLRPRYKIPEFFTIAPVPTSTLTICRRNRGDPLYLYKDLQVTSITNRNIVPLVWPGAAHAPTPIAV